jgi:hypothetical protein
MIYVDSVGRASQHCPTRKALAPWWRLPETPDDLPPNVVYDPQAILALSYTGCRVAQLKGVMVTHDNILPPAAPIDHIAAEDGCERRVRP